MVGWMLGANQRSLNLFDCKGDWCGRVDHLVDEDNNFVNVFEITMPKFDFTFNHNTILCLRFVDLQEAIDYVEVYHSSNVSKESLTIKEWLANARH